MLFWSLFLVMGFRNFVDDCEKYLTRLTAMAEVHVRVKTNRAGWDVRHYSSYCLFLVKRL